MKFWLIVFMVLLALFSPLLRPIVILPTAFRSSFPGLLKINYSTFGKLSFYQTSLLRDHTSIMATTASSTPGHTPEALASTLSSTSSSEPELPKLSAADFRTYNKLAEMMDAYHNHFRYTWNILYKGCSTGTRPSGMSLRQFLSQGLHLCQSLTVHHTIEERHIFPELAERMDIFKPQAHLIEQHEQIHEGLEKFEAFLGACQYGERELRMEEMKEIMDSFGKVLWDHLDLEVKMLGAENIRKYYSKAEISRMNW